MQRIAELLHNFWKLEKIINVSSKPVNPKKSFEPYQNFTGSL